MSSHVYGPVASRRLGRSLGVDIIALKFCSFNCVYCQLGPTTQHTLVRQRFYDPDEIIEQLRQKLEAGTEADYVTFSGSGEPTLSSDIGLLIREVKKLTDVPVAVLTNSSLLSDPRVREELAPADLVVPSLDAARANPFRQVNRPVKGLTLATVISGLQQFTHNFAGRVWLEVLLVKGLNDSDQDVDALLETIPTLRVDRVQLNTVVRPPSSARAKPVPRERLEAIRRKLEELVETEIVVPRLFGGRQAPGDILRVFLELVARRPCSEEELAGTLGLSVSELVELAQAPLQEHLIDRTEFQGKTYYRSAGQKGRLVRG